MRHSRAPSMFSLQFTHMTTCDGRPHNIRVGDVVRLLDENQYRVLKITSPPGRVVLKRTNHPTYRSFPWGHHNYSSVRPAWLISQSRLIHNLLLPMTPSLTLLSNVVDPPLWMPTPKANHIVWVTSILINTSLWDTNFKRESILTIRKQNILKKQHSQNVK